MKPDPDKSTNPNPCGEQNAGAKGSALRPPKVLMLLFSEAVGMLESRWGNLLTPSGEVYRSFSRSSRSGFGPRFGSGASASPRPAEDGLEVCREIDGWMVELVFDHRQMTYSELSERLSGVLEVIRQA